MNTGVLELSLTLLCTHFSLQYFSLLVELLNQLHTEVRKHLTDPVHQ